MVVGEGKWEAESEKLFKMKAAFSEDRIIVKM